MELYLDSANVNEIEQAFKLGFLDGLTTTPTFMQREGVTDIDATIVKLSKIVPVLQIEALGNTAEEIMDEAKRQLDLGLDKKRTVFKIPVSQEGVRACRMMRNHDYLVNIHLVYTLQQAYMAMHAGATYVCALVGRLQDQGHDALALIEQSVAAVSKFNYDSKIMFSSVRSVEHVRNAINLGAHTITVPYKIMNALTENNFTTVGTDQFKKDTMLMTKRVIDVMRDVNPIVTYNTLVKDAIVKMTEYGFGAVTVVDDNNNAMGVFTDGDIRRMLQAQGADMLDKNLDGIIYKKPISIDAYNLLNDAYELFKSSHVDTLVVTKNGDPIGMLDIQDLEH